MKSTCRNVIIGLWVSAIVLIFVFCSKRNGEIPQLQTRVGELKRCYAKKGPNLKEDFRIIIEENTAIAKTNCKKLIIAIADFRTEIITSVKIITEQNNILLEKLIQILEQKLTAIFNKYDKNFKAFSDANTTQHETIEDKVEEILKASNGNAKSNKNLLLKNFINACKRFQEIFNNYVKSFNDLQVENLALMITKQNELLKNTEIKCGQLDVVMGTLTIAIQRQVQILETLPAVEAALELPEII
jgi:hypothetical protein